MPGSVTERGSVAAPSPVAAPFRSGRRSPACGGASAPGRAVRPTRGSGPAVPPSPQALPGRRIRTCRVAASRRSDAFCVVFCWFGILFFTEINGCRRRSAFRKRSWLAWRAVRSPVCAGSGLFPQAHAKAQGYGFSPLPGPVRIRDGFGAVNIQRCV
ncbi:unnamed protein product [Coccothraustes coccothraustes]